MTSLIDAIWDYRCQHPIQAENWMTTCDCGNPRYTASSKCADCAYTALEQIIGTEHAETVKHHTLAVQKAMRASNEFVEWLLEKGIDETYQA